MIQKQFIKKLYKTFALNQRPEMAVDDQMHCLSCEETQKAHSNLHNLKLVSVNDFSRVVPRLKVPITHISFIF